MIQDMDVNEHERLSNLTQTDITVREHRLFIYTCTFSMLFRLFQRQNPDL